MNSGPREWDAQTYDQISEPQYRWGLEVLDRLDPAADEAIIDAGCGSGRVTEKLLERLPEGRVVGVDGSAEMIKVAAEKFAGDDRVTLIVSDLLELTPELLEKNEAPAAADADRIERLIPADLPLADRLGILHSHPTWLVERWLKNFGVPSTAALLEANNRTPNLSCALHDPAQPDEVLAALKRAGLRIEPGQLLRSAFLASGGSPARNESFRRGAISIQDEASQAIPLLLGVQSRDTVLDLCAAPGGKTPPLARAAGSQGTVVATDRHAHRLRAMRSPVSASGSGRGRRG